MNPTKNRIREEWNESEVGRRVLATEMFAINHGFEEWKKPTISDWWLSRIDELLKSQKESLVEKIENKLKNIRRGEMCMCDGCDGGGGGVCHPSDEGIDFIKSLIKE